MMSQPAEQMLADQRVALEQIAGRRAINDENIH